MKIIFRETQCIASLLLFLLSFSLHCEEVFTYPNPFIVKKQIQEKELKQTLTTYLYRCRYITAESVVSHIQPLFPSAKITALTNKNTLLVQGDIHTWNALKDILKKIDVQSKQIYIEAHFYEVSSREMEHLGFELPTNELTQTIHISKGKVTWDDVISKINLLISNGKAKSLAKPTLRTINNSEAQIFIGNKIPVTKANITATSTQYFAEYIDTGINLEILPVLTDENTFRITIKPTISSIGDYVDSPAGSQPIIQNRSFSSTVLLTSGSWFAVGGFTGLQESTNKKEVPVLSGIPVIGKLFTKEQKSYDEREIVFLLRASLLVSGSEDELPDI
ncbi:type II secretion system protein GspD [Candidatus Margulisiibacteriota bacterium]